MIKGQLISSAVFMMLLGSCSGGDSTQSRKGPVDNSTNAQGQAAGENSQAGGEDAGGEGNAALEKDCLAQWDLTVKQSPVGAKFVYKSSYKTMLVENPVEFDRADEIKSSTPELIGHIFEVRDPLVLSLFPGLNGQYVEISKKKFVKTCKKFGTQAGAASAVGKDVTVTGQSDETITIDGKSIAVKKLKIEAKNLKYGTATAEGTADIYVSKLFPALILKQRMEITDSNLPILEGVVITDELKSGLPAQ